MLLVFRLVQGAEDVVNSEEKLREIAFDKELYETDKARADDLGLSCGVHHVSCRQYVVES